MRQKQQNNVIKFYNTYWPKNVPDYEKTKKHILSLIPQNKIYSVALDAGCGTGVCSIALKEVSKKVYGVDISIKSVKTARKLAYRIKAKNIMFLKADILNLPFNNQKFDLILSWGVIHHTDDPMRALDELVRVLKPKGVLILAIYLKTRFTFIHELVRYICLNTPLFPKQLFISTVAAIVKLSEKLGKTNNQRNDNITIESQVEDWFFVPQKHFFTIEEGLKALKTRGLSTKLLSRQTGRFNSSSNFIMRGIKTS